jgi:5-methyltetrahydropteroyltriglutamate--homocysteine methyltransferase
LLLQLNSSHQLQQSASDTSFKLTHRLFVVMETLVDDIGSFPLPHNVDKETFSKAYGAAREAIAQGKDIGKNDFLQKNFRGVVLDSFRKKLRTGLDVVNYPQHYDGIKQVGEGIHKAMEKGTFAVDEKDAFLPEIRVISEEAKILSEEFGKKILLRVSLFGPMELYLKEIGTSPYADVLQGFAETVRRFAKNSVIDSKYVKTEVVSIDEPSYGFLNIAAGNDVIRETLEKAFDFKGATRQIHLHSSVRLPDLLQIKNLDVLTFEYAASPKNIEGVSKRMLEAADKKVRVGVARTDIDTILAEQNDQGVSQPSGEQLVESEDAIRRRYVLAKERFGETMTFTGPDCGLGGWPSQEAAQLLLERTVNAVKSA